MSTSIFAFTRLSALTIVILMVCTACPAIPPGPSPRALTIKKPTTVVVIVQPYSDLEGAVYRLTDESGHVYSRVTVSGTVGGESRSYTYLLTADHISDLNYQLRRSDPLMVDLDCSSCAALYDDLEREGGSWSVETVLYYEYDGKVEPSTELGELRVRNY